MISSTGFISGKQVKELESKLAEYVGVKHCITCGNGTDAITIGLKAMLSDLSADDFKKAAVLVPDFTFFSTGECPSTLGLPTYFVDVKKETFNISPEALERAVDAVLEAGIHTPKVVIAVDLFGQSAEYDKLREICDKYNMYLFEDAAQGFGGKIGDKLACSFGDNLEFLSVSCSFISVKSDIAYKEPAVPRAFNLPTGVIGNKCNVLIPRDFISSSLSIALIKLPFSSFSSIISFPFRSFALKVLILIPIIFV